MIKLTAKFRIAFVALVMALTGTVKADPASFPQWEVRTAPIMFLASWIILDVSHRLSEKWAVGPAAILYISPEDRGGNMFIPSNSGYAVGMNANYYFDSVFNNTVYTSLHSYYENYSSVYHGGEAGEGTDRQGIKTNLALGYQWSTDPLTFLAGGGVEMRHHNFVKKELNQNDEIEKNDGVESQVLPFIEFKVGLEF